MDIIRLLPDSVANQIAAGEVVQRPSSVIKELMENAVDAGASSVDVIVEGAGKTLIQVIDDGKGMSDTDARLAFERHATSKIRKAEDLFTLHTMGFRGEALPSIAAVAQVRLTTRTVDSELGTELTIHGSNVLSQEPCSCSVGAKFEVSNLFYNIPARRKFLKSDKTEMSNIAQEFQRIALANPSVAFSLTQDGKRMLTLPESKLLQRIVGLFGKKYKEQLLEVHVDTTLIRIDGFVGKPESACKRKAEQYLFVNGRYMRNAYFHKAVTEAYMHIIPEDEQIPYFMYFTVDPANIDVNISPTKTEIKFENESSIWPIVVATIKDTLGKFNAIPTIDFDVEGRPEIPTFNSDAGLSGIHQPHIQVNASYNPFKSTSSGANAATTKHVQWENLYAGLEKTDARYPQTDVPDETETQGCLFPEEKEERLDLGSEHFQYAGQYVLTAVQSGLMIVDQRRAHIRILYDRFMKQMDRREGNSQGLLFPEVLTLPLSDAILLKSMEDDLRSLGFDFSVLGGGSFSIMGVPADLDGANPVDVLTQMVETAKDKDSGIDSGRRHRIALVMARSAAIVKGQVLSPHEMDTLLADLFQCQTPSVTPDGKTIVSILGKEQIEKMF